MKLDPEQERRVSRRVPLRQPASVAVLAGGEVTESHPARAINVSGSGVLLECDANLRVGQLVEVSIRWPAKHDGKARLKLVVSGEIVRCDGNTVAATIRRREFRTAGKSLASAAE